LICDWLPRGSGGTEKLIMVDLVTSFRDFVEREELFKKADKLLLACSGGLDSTVLAHLLHAEGYDFAIAHMNFLLRGEASDGDAAFVEELARTLDAGFYCEAVDVKARARPGESTQMTARRIRYSSFNKIRDDMNGRCVLTAHHQDDNFETFLINLIRGTGLAGLKGMQGRNRWSVARPLLTSSREAIKIYARENKIKWREDASNATDKYLRNKIRHKLTPILANDFGLTAASWYKTARNLNSDYRLQQAGLRLLREKYVKTGYNLIEIKLTGWSISDRIVRDDLIFHTATSQGFTPDQVAQILGFTGQRSLDSETHRAYVTPEKIAFAELSSINNRINSVSLTDLPRTLPGYEYLRLCFEIIPRPEKFNQTDAQYLAPQSLPLHLRPRQKGDRFQPLGMGGKTKKVKDYMIDQKIPVWLRDRIYLLTNADDEIMAIPGYCISEGFKVLPHHTEVLKVSAI